MGKIFRLQHARHSENPPLRGPTPADPEAAAPSPVILAPAMRYEARFTGRVQGVGFRAAAHRLALQHNLVGWVRNEPDGSVMLVAEGEKPTLDAFLKALRAEMNNFISEASISESESRGDYAGFEIRY